VPSDLLVYDLQFRLRCSHCNARLGFRITVFDTRTRGDNWKPRLERVVVAGNEVKVSPAGGSFRCLLAPKTNYPYLSTLSTGGIVQVPFRIDGSFSFGQYMRSMRMNFPAGAGSQFDSLFAPGESFWT
jgi:hypothetical protein